MTALLLIAHGSRNAAANAEIAALAEHVSRLGAIEFSPVQASFLELAEPNIAQGCQRLVDAGARTIVLLPYFLAEGNHVARDIPAVLDELRRQHPAIDIRLAPHIGAADAMADLVLACARRET